LSEKVKGNASGKFTALGIPPLDRAFGGNRDQGAGGGERLGVDRKKSDEPQEKKHSAVLERFRTAGVRLKKTPINGLPEGGKISPKRKETEPLKSPENGGAVDHKGCLGFVGWKQVMLKIVDDASLSGWRLQDDWKKKRKRRQGEKKKK